MQAFRGSAKMQLVGNRNKIAQVSQFNIAHGLSLIL